MENIYLPKNLNIKNIEKSFSSTELEQIFIFFNYLFFQTKFIKQKSCQIYSKFIENDIFSKKSIKIVQYLIDLNIIEKSRSYANFEDIKFCKSYSFVEKYYKSKFIETKVEFKYKTNLKKYNNLFLKNGKLNKIDDVKYNVQKYFISKIKINEEIFSEINKNDNIQYKDILINELSNVEKFNYVKEDKFAGRVYNIFTNKSSKIRSMLEFNDKKLSFIDIKSSQLTFLAQLDKFDLKKFDKIEKENIEIDENFKKIVFEDDIYEYFGNKMGWSREKTKKKMLVFLFDTKTLKYNELTPIFQEEFPKTFKTLNYLKQFKTMYNKDYCSFVLQSVEKNTLFDVIKNETEYFTVHDSVYFESGKEQYYKELFTNYFNSKNLTCPKFNY